jgi:hypothetical protein
LLTKEIAMARENKELIQIAEPYVRKKITAYKNDRESQQCSWRQEFGTKAEWRWEHQHSLAPRVKDAAEFKDALDSLKREFPSRESRAEFDLLQFVEAVFEKAVDGISDAEVSELIAMLIADLHESPCDIAMAARLVGVWVRGSDQLVFAGTKLRTVRAEDMEYDRPLRNLLHSPYSSRNRDSFPSAILELQIRGSSLNDAQRKLLKIERTLSLFRLGSIKHLDSEYAMRSITRSGGIIGPSDRFSPIYQFELSSAEQNKLAEFVTIFESLVPDPFSSSGIKAEAAHIAFERYSDALFRAGPIESRITSGITCLEALFLKKGERNELVYKLAIRVAALLRLIGKPALDVQRHVTKAYGIRSTYIHGGISDATKVADSENLCRDVLNYGRLALQIFLQLKTTTAKEDLISKIDESLLDSTGSEAVKSIVGPLCVAT